MAAAPLACPRCAAPLAHLRVGGVDTDVCEGCAGLWLDRLEIRRFDDPSDPYGDALVAHLSQFPAALVDPSARLRCPRHPDVVMLRRPFSGSVDVAIDECPQCGGLWLDANELGEVRRRLARFPGRK